MLVLFRDWFTVAFTGFLAAFLGGYCFFAPPKVSTPIPVEKSDWEKLAEAEFESARMDAILRKMAEDRAVNRDESPKESR